MTGEGESVNHGETTRQEVSILFSVAIDIGDMEGKRGDPGGDLKEKEGR
jgi:hypothetical protein